MSREFRCDPKEYCGNAECCRSKDTVPGLGLGDLYRLSKHTGESIVQLWRTKGDICLTGSKGSRKFPVNFGLLHDPCPYLDTDYSCKVHEVRPFGCATFPLYLFIPGKLNQRESVYQRLKCLQGVEPTAEQLKLGEETSKLMVREADIEVEHFWSRKGGPLHLVVESIGSYFRLADKAFSLQSKRDPRIESPRSHKLVGAVKYIGSLCDSGEIKNGLHFDDFLANLRPVAFALFEDEFVDMFNNLDDKVLRLYDETSAEWQRLLQRMM